METLTKVLEKVRRWTPFVGGALLDEVATRLDDVIPSGNDLANLAQRLHGHLIRLVNIAVAAATDSKDTEAGRLARRARDLRAESTPDDHQSADASLRRSGLVRRCTARSPGCH
ncbi:DUF6415 family natural product biosynthesis protein [Streptomyces sp. NPDC000348]|uniref:DUF6415 family natural product biosynthesis protein n=1 Tax=Streptomyces sp. NPDC000348 TaxID=3364538 RepID=UPI0036AA9B9F